MIGDKVKKDINEQFYIWRKIIDKIPFYQKEINEKIKPNLIEFDEVIFTGAGSSYYLALSSSVSFQKITGLRTICLPASEILFFHNYYLRKGKRYLTILFSRSGETDEIIGASRILKENYRSYTVSIICSSGSKLAKSSDLSFPVPEFKEECLIMTKGFTSMLLLSYVFSFLLKDRLAYEFHLKNISEDSKIFFDEQVEIVEIILSKGTLSKFIYLGGGPFWGLVLESSLKLEEASLQKSNAYTPMEYRHGPKANCDEKTLIISILSSSNFDGEIKLLNELKDLGATIWLLSDLRRADLYKYFSSHPEVELGDESNIFITIAGSGIPEEIRGISYMPFLQYFAIHNAILNGIDPDNPKNLTPVVRL